MFPQMPNSKCRNLRSFPIQHRRITFAQKDLLHSGEVEDYKVYLEPGYCGDGTINQAWEECDGEPGCSDRCLSRR
jgi:hypothetical protein